MFTSEIQKDYIYKNEEHCCNCDRFIFRKTLRGTIYPYCDYYDVLLLVDTQAPVYRQNVYKNPNCISDNFFGL